VVEWQPAGGAARHREAAALWIQRAGLPAAPEQTLLCASAQHAVSIVVALLCQPGDPILVEELTHPGMRDLARWYPLRVHSLPIDREGIMPEALEAACRRDLARVLYCTPTLHNPTTSTMSDARRNVLSEIAGQYGVAIIEDGSHGMLPRSAPKPLSAHAPGSSYYITSLSKTLGPGVRLGILRAPVKSVAPLEMAIRATIRMASPVLAELACQWITNGTALRLLEHYRREADARQRIAHDVLRRQFYASGDQSFHLWMPLPARWRAADFARLARAAGVLVTASSAFSAGRETFSEAVRISLSGPRDHRELKRGLQIIGSLLTRRRREIDPRGPEYPEHRRQTYPI
jgi:DNA-binding transcriptional MocR family regulator